MNTQEARMHATRLFGRLMATSDGRHYLFHNGYTSGQSVVVAQYDEPIGEVMARVHAQTSARVTVALVRGPESEDLLMFEIGPANPQELKDAAVASPRGTIGMLYEAARQSHGSTFRVAELEDAATAVSFKVPSKLLSV